MSPYLLSIRTHFYFFNLHDHWVDLVLRFTTLSKYFTFVFLAHHELMDENLLEHFSQYDPKLLRYIKADTYNTEFAKECKKLYRENYHKRRDDAYNECMNSIKQVNIKENMLKCLQNGYAGFTIYKNPFIGVFSEEQRGDVCKLIEHKVIDAHLKKIVFPYVDERTIVIYIDAKHLGLIDGERVVIEQPLTESFENE